MKDKTQMFVPYRYMAQITVSIDVSAPNLRQDTEFPGVVARPVGDFNQPDYQYQTLRLVDSSPARRGGMMERGGREQEPEVQRCMGEQR